MFETIFKYWETEIRYRVTVSAKSVGIDIGAEVFFVKTETLFQISLIFSYFLGEYKFL